MAAGIKVHTRGSAMMLIILPDAGIVLADGVFPPHFQTPQIFLECG